MIFKLLKFKGKYGELKTHGYKFQKLFAANYLCWHKKVSEFSSCAVWIWKKGTDVELKDLFEQSGVVAEFIRDYQFTDADKSVFGGGRSVRIAINKKKNRIETFDRTIHTDKACWREELGDWDYEALDEWHESYRIISINEDYALMIKELWEKDLVEIVEENLEED